MREKELQRNGFDAQSIPGKGEEIIRSVIPKAHKISIIAHHFQKIMEALELDLENPGLRDTPARVAKMYVEEAFIGLDPDKFPKISLFENTYNYNDMIIVRDIGLYSYCEHHFVPFYGVAHIAYLPAKNVIGLSKLNRVVEFLASKPQIQEKLTMEIANILTDLMETEHIAVIMEATHLCVASRGVRDTQSKTRTTTYRGKFTEKEVRENFLLSIGN